MTRIAFTVIGKPEPAGSKRGIPRKGGGVSVIDDNPHAGPWKGTVAQTAYEAMTTNGYHELLGGPLGLAVIFTVRRPGGHFGSGRNADQVRPSAPKYPITRPDATKLLRGVEDALSGVVWTDDAQVVEQSVVKRYGAPEGAQVVVWTL